MTWNDRVGRRGFELLGGLARERSLAWWHENRDEFDARVVAPFAEVLARAARSVAGEELSAGRGTVFRVRRDPRFAPEGEALWPWVEGVLAPTPRHIGARGAVAVRLEADGGTLSAGSFLLGGEARRALRRAMIEREAEFLGIVARLEGGSGAARVRVESEKNLERAPRGMAEWADLPIGRFLRMQEPVARIRVPKGAWTSGRAWQRIRDFALATRAWRTFQVQALAEVAEAPARPPRSPTGTVAR